MRNGFDITEFALDYRVDIYTEGKQCRPGWKQFLCPYCNSRKPFLGFNMAHSYFNCYYCGFHPLGETLLLLGDISPGKLRLVYRKYSTDGLPPVSIYERKQNNKTTIPTPKWWKDLSEAQLDYLYERGFNEPERLAKTWGLYGSDHLAPRGYGHRIVIPYYNNSGRVLCYTTRSVSDEVETKYKASPVSDEVWDVKDTLYGLWNVPGDVVVALEGQVDTWKLGMGAVCTGGTGYSQTQVRLLSGFSKRYILFDNEPLAQQQANTLAEELSCFDGDTYVLSLPDGIEDPGELTEAEGKKIMKDLIYEDVKI